MALPEWLARFNRVVTNRVTGPFAGRLPGFGVVEHTGRTSGKRYRTPVNVFPRDGGFTIALTYGSGSQWVKNVVAAGKADIVSRGRTHHVVNPQLIVDKDRSAVPGPVRVILRAVDVDEFMLVDSAGDS